MEKIKSFWTNALDNRRIAVTFRTQQGPSGGVDFCSNDYLGLAANTAFQRRLTNCVCEHPTSLMGVSGSRIIRGHSDAVAEVEQFIAEMHEVEDALLVGSGYIANLALLSCVLQRGDTILLDEHVHRSVHDACKLSSATKWKFRHNDLKHLGDLLQKATGRIVVVIESLYSMDGDFAPIEAIIALSARFAAGVIVDEAHAVGTFGKGLLYQRNLQKQVIASVVTYGKAFGLSGAAILCSKQLKDYLLNFSSPLIYTTGLPAFHALSIQQAYLFLEQEAYMRDQLKTVVGYFGQQEVLTPSDERSPIQSVRFKSNAVLMAATEAIKKDGLDVYPIFSPTVKEGTERLRICLHVFNTKQQIDVLGKHIRQWQ